MNRGPAKERWTSKERHQVFIRPCKAYKPSLPFSPAFAIVNLNIPFISDKMIEDGSFSIGGLPDEIV